jgi:hypothetical protein
MELAVKKGWTVLGYEGEQMQTRFRVVSGIQAAFHIHISAASIFNKARILEQSLNAPRFNSFARFNNLNCIINCRPCLFIAL